MVSDREQCSLVVNEEGQDEEHLEEASEGADLDGVDVLDGLHQQRDDGEEHGGQEAVEQAQARASLLLPLRLLLHHRRHHPWKNDESTEGGEQEEGFEMQGNFRRMWSWDKRRAREGWREGGMEGGRGRERERRFITMTTWACEGIKE